MPIRDDEKFCKCFIADTKAEAEELLKEFDYNLKLLANKVGNLTGLDKEDLYQEGIIGLARAKRDFDEERSDNFKTFAIYKIKDAMREFGTTQSVSMKVPQYTKDAVRLANVLKEHLIKAGEYRYNALADMWDSSSKYTGDSPLEKSIQVSRQSLINLANRSHTSVRQLLERSEATPSCSTNITELNINSLSNESSEDNVINRINAVDMIKCVKEYLSGEDYELLWNRYVEGMTVRELAPLMGISAPYVSDRTQVVLNKLRKLLEKDTSEINTNIKEIEP